MPSYWAATSRIVAVLGTLYSVLGTAPAVAHPLFNKFYERTVDVCLATDASGQVVVEVNYQLEVNQFIALLDAKILLEQRKEEEPGKAREYYEAFSRLHAPLLADRLYAKLDDCSLEFTCVKRGQRLNTKDGTLHCEFVFRAFAQPPAAEKHVLTIEEGSYKEEAGRVLLSLRTDPAVNVLAKDEPSAELKARSPADLKIGDDERMRQGSLTFTLSTPTEAKQPLAHEEPPTPAAEVDSPSDSLLDLLFKKDEWFVICLLGAAGWGAAHALTPGHGKTLVAAYLVGERGTLFHALILGLSTTFAHTGAVIGLAVVFWFYPRSIAGAQVALRYVGAVIVAGMGFWLIYRRLSGQADHVHLGGGHHHYHGPTDHDQGHATIGQDVGPWNLILLGLAGGIVPCPSAIILLIAAINNGAMTRALPLVLAFSAGLAVVLVVIGMLVVTSKRFAESRFGGNRLFRLLPALSAVLVLGLGLWLFYDASRATRFPVSGKP